MRLKSSSFGKNHWLQAMAVYVAIIFLWFGLWFTVWDRFWWLTMVNRIIPVLFLPAILFLIVGFWRRSRLQIVLSILPLLIFLWLYWPYFQTNTVQETDTAVLRVMSFNVLFSNQAYEKVAETIREYEPDLVALQEVQPRLMTQLQKLLQDEYPYNLMAPRNQYGTTAVFSRHPFSQQQILDLGDDRPAAVVTIEKEGQLITFAAVHLRAYGLQWVPPLQIPQAVNERTALQNRQAEILLEELAQHEGIVIIGCDCNSKETSSSYRLLHEAFENASHGNGLRPFATPPPGTHFDTGLNHIDYIFYRGNIQPLETLIIKNKSGSDHNPLFSTLSFNE